jgi:O-antigen biosynthesis protein
MSQPNEIKIVNKRVIVVLGMHRSGTSAITRGLQVLGVLLGDRLLPPANGENDKGYWEDFDIYSLNNEMLNAINKDWHCIASIRQRELETLKQNGYLDRAIELIRQKTYNVSIFGFKDPRIPMLLPFWKEAFIQCQYDVSYVLAVRNPLSIAKSLAKRNGFDIEMSYLLWLNHVINSLSGTIGCNRIIVDYDKLMQDAEKELNRIAAALHLTMDTAELEIYKTEFLDNTLRHFVYELNDLLQDEAASAMVREVYKTVMDLSFTLQIDDEVLQEKAYKWKNELVLLNPALTLADKLFNQLKTSEQSMNVRDATINSLNKQLLNQEQLTIQKTEEIVKGKETLNLVYSSKSWRITKLLRIVSDFLHKKVRKGVYIN